MLKAFSTADLFAPKPPRPPRDMVTAVYWIVEVERITVGGSLLLLVLIGRGAYWTCSEANKKSGEDENEEWKGAGELEKEIYQSQGEVESASRLFSVDP